MRVGIIRDCDAKWYAEKKNTRITFMKISIRKFVFKKNADAAVSTIEIERAVNKVNVSLHTAKNQVWLSKKVVLTLMHRSKLNKLTGKQVHINIIDITNNLIDAHTL